MAELALGVTSQACLLLARFPKLSPQQFHFTPSISLTLQNRHSLAYRNPLTFTSRVISSDSKSPSIISDNVDLASDGIEVNEGDGGGNFGGGRSGGEGGGGDSSGGGGDRDDGEEEGRSKKTTTGMSMSQKLTLGYAALVGRGLMGYMKSGSSKSLLAGGLSASALYYVYMQLPTNPAYASSIGLGVSTVLAGVMTSRFMRSKKIFPAGVVSVVSLIMTGGYIHGILRTAH